MCMAHPKSVLFKMAQAMLQQAKFQIHKTLLSEEQLKKEPKYQIFITCQHCKWRIEMFIDSIYYNIFNTANFSCVLCTHGLREYVNPEAEIRNVAENFYILQHMASRLHNICDIQCSFCSQHRTLY